MVFLFLILTLALPLAFISVLLFLLVSRIRSPLHQVLVLSASAIGVTTLNIAIDPLIAGQTGIVYFISGILLHPLWMLVPFPFFEPYFDRIRPVYVVFIATFATATIFASIGAIWGDLLFRPEFGMIDILSNSAVAVTGDIVVVSFCYGVVLLINSKLKSAECAEQD